MVQTAHGLVNVVSKETVTPYTAKPLGYYVEREVVVCIFDHSEMVSIIITNSAGETLEFPQHSMNAWT